MTNGKKNNHSNAVACALVVYCTTKNICKCLGKEKVQKIS